MEAAVYLPFALCKDVILLTLCPIYLARDAELCIPVVLFVVNSHALDQNEPSATPRHLCSLCQVCMHPG